MRPEPRLDQGLNRSEQAPADEPATAIHAVAWDRSLQKTNPVQPEHEFEKLQQNRSETKVLGCWTCHSGAGSDDRRNGSDIQG